MKKDHTGDYCLDEVLKEDFGIKNNQIGIDIEKQTMWNLDKDVVKTYFYLVYPDDDTLRLFDSFPLRIASFFEAADDDSAKLIFELGEDLNVN